MLPSIRIYLLAILLVAAAGGFTYWQLSGYHGLADMQRIGRDATAEVVQVTTGRGAGRKARLYRTASLKFDGINFDRGQTLPPQYSKYSNFPHIAVGESVTTGSQLSIIYDPADPKKIIRGATTASFSRLLSANDRTPDFIMRISISAVCFSIAGALAWALIRTGRHVTLLHRRPPH
ncbi:MAG: hypothetical protein ACR2NX_13950 [Chthoniobacterales bacterium]